MDTKNIKKAIAELKQILNNHFGGTCKTKLLEYELGKRSHQLNTETGSAKI
jgi:hypothetical protein